MTALIEVEARSTTDDERWSAVLGRSRDADGTFVTAVRSTGIYCRPSCPARHPHRENVTFFAAPEQARAAGFRACKRCRPDEPRERDDALVSRACAVIDAGDGAVTLAALTEQIGVDEGALVRAFRRVLGVTPKQYADARRVERLKDGLRSRPSGGRPDVTRAMYDAGYSSGSRLYEVAESRMGMTPATYGRRGRGAEIAYSIVPSPLGRLLVAATGAGICAIKLGDDDAPLEAELHAEFSAATTITRDDENIAEWMRAVLARIEAPASRLAASPLPLDIRGTAFQRLVWQELQRTPAGATRTYGDIAGAIGHPRAARAVGRACATNPAAIVIPCHRAVGGDGSLTGYAYGIERKRELIDREARPLKRRARSS